MVSTNYTLKKEPEIWSEFCSKTSVHGLQYLSRGKHISYRIIWSIILTGVFVGSGFHLYKLISSYLRYNYYTSITMEGESLKVKFLRAFYFCTHSKIGKFHDNLMFVNFQDFYELSALFNYSPNLRKLGARQLPVALDSFYSTGKFQYLIILFIIKEYCMIFCKNLGRKLLPSVKPDYQIITVFFNFQFPWVTLCGSHHQSQLGTIKHTKLSFQLAREQGKIFRFTKNFGNENSTHGRVLRYFERVFVATFFLNCCRNRHYSAICCQLPEGICCRLPNGPFP